MSILKEFDLEIPGDKVQKRNFSLQVRCITALYERLFPKFRTPDCWKILVNCVQNSPKVGYRNFSGVYEIDVIADVENFINLSEDEKKAWIYETLYLGITNLLKITEWDSEPFIVTFEKIKELNLQNVWVWKSVRSPSRKYFAEVVVDHDIQNCSISLIIRDDTGGKIKQKEMIKELPSEWAYARHLGSFTWESNSQVILRSKDKESTWILKL